MKSRIKRWITVLLLIGLATVGDYYLYPKFSSWSPPPPDHTTNGAWMRHTWYFGQRSGKELSDSIDNLERNSIAYAYYHVRSTSKDGRLKYRFPAQARQLTAAIHRQSPQTKAIAWIFIGNQKKWGGVVDLSDSPTRQTIIAEALFLTTQAGFDGIQYDYEICRDGDPGFLELLKETRAALPAGKIMSVASPMWMPAQIRSLAYWSENYFTQVAKHADQIAVMCYDSAMPTPRAYVWLLTQQVIRVSNAVAAAHSPCNILFGVPTYFPGGRSHNPHVENISVAIKGIRRGIARHRTDRSVIDGIALFAEYTTDDTEWQSYRNLWLSGSR